MKRNVLFLLLYCLWLATPAYAQTSCADFQLLRENASYEMLTYDGKDRQTGRVVYNVQDVKRTGGKAEADVHSEVYDQKGRLASEGDFTIGCNDGTIWMDMRSLMSPDIMGAYKDMEMTMTGDKMLYPNKLTVGQTLQDGTMTMEMKDRANGQNMMTMVMKVMDRKVEGKESIQVPAGSYNSYKIRQNTEVENRAMGMKMPGARIETVEYYVPEIGTVRSETYRNGKLQSYTVLSKIK
ncbi:MAG: hypothetical protein LPK03_13060 [Pontibacter sp.]|nr:hypothetical protein [Pontibacter sp.]